jgi:hypothetical protein
MKIFALEYIYVTNAYPQERETSAPSSNIQAFKRGDRGSDPSQPSKLCTEVVAA